MITMVAVTFFAVMSQAGSFNWSLMWFAAAHQNGDNFVGNVYLILTDASGSNLGDIHTSIEAGTFMGSSDILSIGIVPTAGWGGTTANVEVTKPDTVLVPNSELYVFALYFDAPYTGLPGTSGSYLVLGPPSPNPSYVNPSDDFVGGIVFGMYASQTPLQGWTNYTIIPEPATGALALAGLALLFRRKRK